MMWMWHDDGRLEKIGDADLSRWGLWMSEIGHRRVGSVRMQAGNAIAQVSTVFLGVDHGAPGRPILWETLCRYEGGPSADDGMDEDDEPVMIHRYATFDIAKAGHIFHVQYWYGMLLRDTPTATSVEITCDEDVHPMAAGIQETLLAALTPGRPVL